MTLLLVFLIGVAAGGAAGVLLMALAAVADRASVSFGPDIDTSPIYFEKTRCPCCGQEVPT